MRLYLTLVLGLIGGSIAGCSGSPQSSERASGPVVAVRAAPVERRVFADVVEAPGRWRASGEIVLTAPFAGTLDSLGATVGDAVSAGSVVARLATRESRAALRGAELLASAAHTEADRREAERALGLARRGLVSVPIRAPVAGRVIRRPLEPGSSVESGGEVLALVAPGAVVFEARIPASASSRIRPGERGVITEEGTPDRGATVLRLLPVGGEGDQSTLAWLAPGPGPAPVIDRYGTARIITGPPRDAIAVPDSALVQDDVTGVFRVLTVSPDSLGVWIEITPGDRTEGWREIVAPPLAPGLPVVVSGQTGLADSTRLAIVR